MTDHSMNAVSFEIELLDKHKDYRINISQMIYIGA
jgi:hypothetical protein